MDQLHLRQPLQGGRNGRVLAESRRAQGFHIHRRLLARGAKNTDYIWRVSPSFTYTAGNLALALEMDYTAVGYGDEAIDGRAKALRTVDNWRICTMIRYSF